MAAELALAELERQVLEAGRIANWLERVAAIRQALAAESPNIQRMVLALAAPKLEAQALGAVLEAYGLGATDALDIVTEAGKTAPGKLVGPSKAVRKTVAGLDASGAEALRQAVTLAKAGAEPSAYTAPLFGHANRVSRAVTTAVNGAGNEGARAVATAAKLPTVWVAETNACVHCLAYSGRVAPSGGKFPGGLTYGAKSYWPNPLKHPPLHPHCRCSIEPLVADEYADALRREADRSVLRGFSLESESMGTRVDAAARLLERGVEAPASVLRFARRAVKAGEFAERGRPANR